MCGGSDVVVGLADVEERLKLRKRCPLRASSWSRGGKARDWCPAHTSVIWELMCIGSCNESAPRALYRLS